ncbi:hypothetical protein FRC09_004395 [Ceratobasidium sp. 395]|nr:hypothetical protein FRC09_004395 [Ceratobasidium sp. 395]
MDLDIARFITTKGRRVKVFDEAFENPAHESCYSKGTCDLCVARRAQNEAAGLPDTHLVQRNERRNELTVIFESGRDVIDLTHKTKSKVPKRIGDEYDFYRTHLDTWRDKKFMKESETCYLGPEEIMTDAALDSIARSRNVVDMDSFDLLKPAWTQRRRWGQEILAVIQDTTREWEEKQVKAQAEKVEQKEAEKVAKNRKKTEERRKREEERRGTEREAERDAEIAQQVERETEKAAREARQAGEVEGRRRVDEIVRQTYEHAQQRSNFDSPIRHPAPQHAHLPAMIPNRPVSRPSVPSQRRAAPSSPAIHQFNLPPVQEAVQSVSISRAEALRLASGDTSMNREAISGASRRMGREDPQGWLLRPPPPQASPKQRLRWLLLCIVILRVLTSHNLNRIPLLTQHTPARVHIPQPLVHLFVLKHTIPTIHTQRRSLRSQTSNTYQIH